MGDREWAPGDRMRRYRRAGAGPDTPDWEDRHEDPVEVTRDAQGRTVIEWSEWVCTDRWTEVHHPLFCPCNECDEPVERGSSERQA